LCSGRRGFAIESVKARGIRSETPQRRIEEAHRAAQGAALGVVIRGGELDQTLIEVDELPLGVEPELLPAFMSFPELGGVEVGNAFGEVLANPWTSFRAAASRTSRR